LTYNVQNLFDDVDDGTEYRDYDPGAGRWDTSRYHAKLGRIAEVILAAEPDGPSIVVLQEIENVGALAMLAETYLGDSGYREAVLVPTPGSAVNVAVLSKLPVGEIRSHAVSFLRADHPLRDVLEVWVDLGDGQLVVLANHWKSRSGGARATAPMRRAAAGVVARRVAQLSVTDPEVDVIVAGDLNVSLAENGEYLPALVPAASLARTPGGLAYTFEPSEASVGPQGTVLFSPWRLATLPGSYVYQDRWETIDHFLLAPGLVDGEGWEFSAFRVVREAFMMTTTGAPRRWIEDSGYSDHFPLLLTLSRRRAAL
jgi:endonuclease/exonuclease/phosphatase family metal-dependent hydrolase